MSWLANLLSSAMNAAQKIIPSATKITVDKSTVTSGQLETAAGSLGAFFAAFSTAVKTKNLQTGVEITLQEAVTLAADLGLGEPFTGIAKIILPLVFDEFNTLAAEPLVAVEGGLGGFVTQAWIDDPRHKLDANGGFKN